TVYVIAGSVPPSAPSRTFTVNVSDPANPTVPLNLLPPGTGTIVAQAVPFVAPPAATLSPNTSLPLLAQATVKAATKHRRLDNLPKPTAVVVAHVFAKPILKSTSDGTVAIDDVFAELYREGTGRAGPMRC